MSLFRGAGGGGSGGGVATDVDARLVDEAGQPIDLTGCSVYRLAASAAGLNAASVKVGAGTVEGLKAKNASAFPVLVSLFDDDAADGDPADDNLRDVLELPAGAIGFYDFPGGLKFTAGIGIRITRLDGAPVAAGDLTNLALYFR